MSTPVFPPTTDQFHAIAAERGFVVAFVTWLLQQGWLLFHNGHLATPVHDKLGQRVGVHYRLPDRSWRYNPLGLDAGPLVIGDLTKATTVYAFESQWDAFAAMSIFDFHKTGVPVWLVIVITRGAGNGKSIAGLLRPEATVCAFVQNDVVKNGKNAAEVWLQDVARNAGVRVLRVVTPPEHEDLNAWTKAGATSQQITAAIQTAPTFVPPPVPTPTPAVKAPTPKANHIAESETRAFPVELYPEPLVRYVQELSECLRVPPSMVATSVLLIVSACLGKNLRAKLIPGKVTPGNLFLLLVARSGTGKTDLLRQVAKPLFDYEMEVIAEWTANAQPRLLAERDELLAKRKRLKNKAQPVVFIPGEEAESELTSTVRRLSEIENELREPCLTAENVTAEKLAVLLGMNDEALTSISSEAGEVLDNLAGRHNRDRPDESLYLKCYSLERLKCDRITRKSVLLSEPCLTVLWMTQPDKMDKLLANDRFIHGGLLARLMVVFEEAAIQKIEGPFRTVSEEILQPFHGLTESLISKFRKGTLHIVEGDSGAVQALVAFHNEIAERREKELADVDSFAARYGEWACRVTVVLHAMEHGAAAGESQVVLQTAQRAIAITQWFIDRHLSAVNEMRQKQEQALRELVLNYLVAYEKPQPLRDIYRKLRRPAPFVEELIQRMVDDNELSKYPIDNGKTGYHLPSEE
jgi:hypothetical protein